MVTFTGSTGFAQSNEVLPPAVSTTAGKGSIVAGSTTSSSAQGLDAASKVVTASGFAEPSPVTAKSFPKNLLQDQEAFWTFPFHLNTSDLSFIVPAVFGSAALIGSDTYIESHLPQSPSTVSRAASASTAGMLALVGAGGGLFVWGEAIHDEHRRETGILTGEAAIDAYAITTAFKYMTQRERPYTGDGKGSFFYGGDSFPSDTAAVSWATASVIAHEYPGFMSKVLAYGVAGGVTAGRIIGQKHWTSDAVIGSALGWYVGRQIYRARSAGPEINASTWGTFEKAPDEDEHDPAYMGTAYVPLQSWIYPAFDRLTALGYLPTAILAIRPWPRLECARRIQEAEDEIRDDPESIGGDATKILRELRLEFAQELAHLEGQRNVGAQLESAYARLTPIAGTPLRDSFNFAQTLYNDYGRPYGQGLNAIVGMSGRAEAGPLAFYVQGEFQHSSGMQDYSVPVSEQIAAFNVLPSVAAVARFPEQNRFRTIEAYVALNVANWQLSFGQQSLDWSPSYGGSLILSNNAEAMPMLRIARVVPYQIPGFFAWLGKIRNTAYIGRLGGYNYVSGPWPTFSPLYGNAFQSINPQPYTWGDKLALKMSPNFEIGVSLSVIWGGYGRPAILKTWLHTFSTNGNNQTLDPGKRYTGFNFSYRIPGMRNWLTLYADGMANDEPNPIRYPRQSAWNPGLYLTHLPKLPNLDLRVEGIYTNIPSYPGSAPYYSNVHYRQGYVNYGQLMGSWVGRQGDGWQAWSTYWFTGQDKIQFGYRRQYNDPVMYGGGGLNDFSTTLEWVVKNQVHLSSTLQYERWNFPLLTATPKSDFVAQFQLTYWPLHAASSANRQHQP